jgi:hypothetical protein
LIIQYALLIISILLILPLFSLTYKFFLYKATTALLSLLSLTSLLSTAYTLYSIPLRLTPPKGKKPIRNGLLGGVDVKGPLEAWLPILNDTITAILALGAIALKGRVEEVWFFFMPGLVNLIVRYARWQMASVDVDGLEGLRYRYKGA